MLERPEILKHVEDLVSLIKPLLETYTKQAAFERQRIAAAIETCLRILDKPFLEGNFVYKTEERVTGFWRKKTEHVQVESYSELMVRLAEKYISMEKGDE